MNRNTDFRNGKETLLMKKIVLFIFSILTFVSAVSAIGEAYIIDTGYPTVPNNYLAIWRGQWVANEFNITGSGVYITDIEGYFRVDTATASVTVELTRDGGNFPSSQVLYSQSFNMTHNYNNHWDGIYGISGLKLLPGTYWIVFKSWGEVSGSGAAYSAMTYKAQNPLGNGAISYNQGSSWQDADSRDLSIRISGEPIPEPISLLLLGFGVVGLVSFGRLKKKG